MEGWVTETGDAVSGMREGVVGGGIKSWVVMAVFGGVAAENTVCKELHGIANDFTLF